MIDLFVSLLSESWILKTLGFALLVGSVMELLERSGGIEAFLKRIDEHNSIINTPRGALFLPYLIGIVIFIESSITSLIAGAVGKPLCHKHKIPAEKLAFVCDSTSAPISSLIVLNGWGALLLGLITTQIESGYLHGESVSLLLHAVGYNFYAMAALGVTFIFIYFGLDVGAMKKVQYKPKEDTYSAITPTATHFMFLPILLMIVLVFVFLYITGSGDILHGSGSSSIFYTMISLLGFIFVYYIGFGVMDVKTYLKASYAGVKKLFPIASILLFAFAIGKVTTQLHTGLYLASLAQGNVDAIYVAPLIFVLSAIIAFSTGTSWGTFSIMIPVAVPMAVGLDANVLLAMGAVISGGVFGDHCSPISDTTIISSMASECEVISHVKTQLPYALISGAIACGLFLVLGA